MQYDIVIVGAGLAGATAARTLAEKGNSVLVIEQHKHVAGHCHDYRNEHGIFIHTYGPHIFHTHSKKVWDFVNTYTGFRYYQHRVLSYAEGELIPFPINKHTLEKVFGQPVSTKDVPPLLKEEVERSDFNDPPENFRDAVVSQVGERLYSLFFENYTRKQWDTDPKKLSAEIAKRIPVRENIDCRYFSDKYQGIPEYGYTHLVNTMLDHANIAILLGQNYFTLRDRLSCKTLIYTGELDRYFDYTYGKLPYRSLDLVLKTFDQPHYQPAPVVNYPNDYDWTRITEFKYFLDEQSEKTTVCFEYPKAEGEPYYVVLTEENISRREKYSAEVEKLKEDNIYFVGRLAEYKYYNMDQVILAALELCERVC